ncbi:DUF5675 family protein [Moritella viscosa]
MLAKTLTLHRNCFSHGTFSILCDDNGKELCKVLERPWLNNQASISCVPFGTYDFLPHESPKFGQCYALEAPSLGVTRYGPSQRTHILMHKANKVSQLQGCLAPDWTLVSWITSGPCLTPVARLPR